MFSFNFGKPSAANQVPLRLFQHFFLCASSFAFAQLCKHSQSILYALATESTQPARRTRNDTGSWTTGLASTPPGEGIQCRSFLLNDRNLGRIGTEMSFYLWGHLVILTKTNGIFFKQTNSQCLSRITPRDASAPKGRFRNLPQARTPTSCPSATTRDYHKCGGVNAENGILMMAFENLWRNYGRPRVLVVFELNFYFAGVWPPTKKAHKSDCDEL